MQKFFETREQRSKEILKCIATNANQKKYGTVMLIPDKNKI